MFCPKCGAKLSEDSLFCPKCGAQIAAPQTHVESPVAEQQDETPQPGGKLDESDTTTKKTGRKKKWIILGAIIVVVAIIATILTINILNENNAKKNTDARGQITLHAILTCSGNELSSLLDKNNYEYANVDGLGFWGLGSGNSNVSILAISDDVSSPEQLVATKSPIENNSLLYIVKGYSTSRKAIDAQEVTIEKSAPLENSSALVTLVKCNSQRCIVTVEEIDDNETSFTVYSEQYVASGKLTAKYNSVTSTNIDKAYDQMAAMK